MNIVSTFRLSYCKAKQEREDAMVVYHLHGQFHFGKMVSKTQDWDRVKHLYNSVPFTKNGCKGFKLV